MKNVLEMYPGGLKVAVFHFDDAWEWAKHYKFSNLSSITSGICSSIVDDNDGLLSAIIGGGDAFKEEARELLLAHMISHGEDFKTIMSRTLVKNGKV